MRSLTITLALLSGCDLLDLDTKETAPILDTGDGFDTTIDTSTTVSGSLLKADASYHETGDASAIVDEYDLTGQTIACEECLYAFEGQFQGSTSEMVETITVRSTGDTTYWNLDLVRVYKGDALMAYGYDDGEVTQVTNRSLWKSSEDVSYAYTGTWKR